MSDYVKIALGLIAAGAVLFIAGSMFGGKGIMLSSNFRIETRDDFETYQYQNLDMEAFDKVDIDVSDVPVTFLPAPDGKSYGVEVSYQTTDRDEIKIAVEDKKLIIKIPGKMYWFSFDLSFLTGKDTEESIIVYLPQNVYENISVKNSNASVTMEELNTNIKEIKIITSNAGINLSGLEADELSAHTSNGTIRMEKIAAEKVETDTSNGAVTLIKMEVDELKADTSNGKVTIEEIDFRNRKGKMTVTTSNAAIELSLPDYAQKDCEIKAKTSNAGISVNGEDKDNKYVTGDGDILLHLGTSNGKIEMNFGLD